MLTILLIIPIALLHAAPVNTDELLSALVRDTYPEKVKLTAQQITDLLVQHYKQMETLNDHPKVLKMTGERAGNINRMTVDGVSGSNNVFINGDNNAVTNNNYYFQIGSNADDLDHLITLIMNLTQQDDTDDDVRQMVNDVIDIARDHVPEEPEETSVSLTTEMWQRERTVTESTTSAMTLTMTASTTRKTTSTSTENTTTTTSTTTTSTTTTSTTTTSTTTTSTTSTTTSTTSTTVDVATSSVPVDSEPLDVQLKMPSSIDRRCPTCIATKSIASCFKTQTTCSSDQVCSIELRSRNTRIESVTMGCKQRQACHTDNRQNDGQCRPWMRNGPSVCRTCCNGPSCYVTLQQFKNRPFRSAVSSWSKLF